MKVLPVLAALALAACGSTSRPTTASDCKSIEYLGARFTDCLADPGHSKVRLIVDPAIRDLPALAQALRNQQRSIRFAMNGGMYDDQGAPIGLAIADGRTLHPLNRNSGAGNFHLLPNGVFSVEADGWHIRTADDYAGSRQTGVQIATQSGPMLVIGGKLHPKITPDGPSRYVRNAVGIDAAGKAHFVISDQPVSFGVLARLFRDRLHCANALYLDGSVSALWDPGADRIDQTVPLGPLLVVEKT